MFPKSKKRFQDQEEMKLMSEISRFLVGIGIYPKYTGYNYIVMAVSHVVSLDGARTTLGDIYRHIGELMGKTPGTVERSIRFVLEKSICSRNILHLNDIFGYDVFHMDTNITAGELIYLIADRIMYGRLYRLTAQKGGSTDTCCDSLVSFTKAFYCITLNTLAHQTPTFLNADNVFYIPRA